MNINNLVRENIKKLKPYTSARDSYLEGILLDANENSLGSTFEYKDLELNRYPDPAQKELRKMMGEYLGISFENLFFGVGSDEIIDLLIRIFCSPGRDSVILTEPTYGMYKVACDINEVYTKIVLLDDSFQIDLNEIKKEFDESVKMIFLCSPNNPTGNLLKKSAILELCKDYNAIIVVDEAYVEFAESGSVIKEVENYDNLVVMRTFSKAWGLAGVRCGYCAAGKDIIDYLMKVKAPYNLNKLTREAVAGSFRNLEKKNRFLKEIISERERVKEKLNSMAGVLEVFPSDANYLLFKVDNPKEVHRLLAEKGIIIRDRSSQVKLAGCLRATIGTPEENDLFIKALKEVL